MSESYSGMIADLARYTLSRAVSVEESAATTTSPAAYLPPEIIEYILGFVPDNGKPYQLCMSTCCRINKAWYEAAIGRLYRRPILNHHTHPLFIRTVSPTRWSTSHQSMMARDFGVLVEILDLRRLSFEGTASETARLIGRCKKSLRVFRAPVCPPTGASSFGNVCFVALGNCPHLEILDLALVSASRWPAFHKMLRHLPGLKELSLPSTGHDVFSQQIPYFFWPSMLETLYLSRCMSPLINALGRPSAHDSPLPPLTTLIIHGRGEWNQFGQNGVENFMQPVIELFVTTLVELSLVELSTSHLQLSLIIPDSPAFCPQLRKLAIQDNVFGFPDWPEVSQYPVHPLQDLTLYPASGQDGENRYTALSRWPGNTQPLSILRLLQYSKLLDNLRSVTYHEGTRWFECFEDEPDGPELIAEIGILLERRAVDRGLNDSVCGVFAIQST